MGKITISTLDKMKASGEKFVCITAYDATFSRIISEVGAEDHTGGRLTGYGLAGPRQHHSCHYRRHGLPHRVCLPGRAPIPGHRRHALHELHHPQQAMVNATHLMQAGAHMVKMEGGTWLSDTISSWWSAAFRCARTWA